MYSASETILPLQCLNECISGNSDRAAGENHLLVCNEEISF